MNIGKKIKEIRKKNKISLSELSDKLGVSSEKITFWEKDLNRPANSVLGNIADICDVEIDYFFNENYICKDSQVEINKDVKKNKKTKKGNENIYENENQILNELIKLNKNFEILKKVLLDKPDLNCIKEIEITYSMEKVNELLKNNWILLELFKDERGILGYRVGFKG